ncbi:FhaA domain-containing protein [Collinsella bouchesdurhonensis]|uniref:FhaA domain-containing protein n=1 Tax=Collinsella bouchesdurhonensis TaxID=1907654 RepID=UPI003F892D64
MKFLNTFEDHVAGILGAARAPFSFKKLAKQAAHEMEDQTLVVNGVNTAPALYTILIANDDDPLMAPYYPQLSREVSEFVKAQAEKKRYTFVGEPLVRFMIDPSLKGGKFSVFAENVDAPTLGRLYEEERAYQNGMSAPMPRQQQTPRPIQPAPAPQQNPIQPAPASRPVAQVPSPAAVENDPFAPNPPDPAAPIPVPQTVTREAIAGMGGAAATGGAIGAAASIAANMANARANQAPAQPLAQLIDVVTRETLEVNAAHCIIGRERAAADVILRDPNVSRRHAELTFTGSDWSIEDLNSTNGTFVNNRRITRCPLRNGDLLTFGLSNFEFRS